MSRVVERGTVVSFLTPNHSWVLGTVDAYDQKSNTYACSATDPEPIKQKVKNAPEEFYAARLEYLEEDVNDLMMLTELHEASLLFCLKRRYMRDVVYTNIGPIVVALNPFTFDIPWYKEEMMPQYLNEGVVIERNLPHSWAVAHNTYWEMRENRCNQTILISGESGAGKTEGAKIVVKYVGILSTLHGTVEQRESCAKVNLRVNAASPILEAFGNAKTVRNDNSSRFGKFMKIQFDKEGFLIGSHQTKYLLEKSRIITASKDERVYHSFYLLAGGKDNKLYGIRGAALHKSMKAGECLTIPDVDENVQFAQCVQAFSDVGITPDEQSCIWRVCAGILFMQNTEFLEKEERNVRVSVIDPDWTSALERACELWGVPHKDVERELLMSTRVQRGETVVQHADRAKATDTRDSLSKGLYAWLFDWLFVKINVTTDDEAGCSQWIGLLDIFGFEDFEKNSFEQLCINLANETLQNHYNFFIFTEDVRECREEGIDTTLVTFEDNKGCIDLLAGGKLSIFAMLDDECKVGSGTDQNFLRNVINAFQATKQQPGNPFFAAVTGKQKDAAFKVRHYAGDVTYVVDGFLEKNRDTLKDAMKEVLLKSSVALIPQLVPPLDDPSRPQARTTVSAFFNKQLQELMTVINSTNPHWIRCIKPHPAKRPRKFSHQSVMQQLRSAGVLATVTIRQAGYPIRFKQDVFTARYRILMQPGDGDTVAAKCKAIFQRLDIVPEIGQLGKTKVFLRQAAFLRLNHAKDDATQTLSLRFQAVCRGNADRALLFQLYVKKHRERLMAELKAREEAAKRRREEDERRRRAEEEERERRERADRERRLRAAVTVQRYVRGHLCRVAFSRHFVELLRAEDEFVCDDNFARCRQSWELCDGALRALEAREAERRKQREKGDATFYRREEGDRTNAYELMLKRREVMQQRRTDRTQKIDEKNRSHEVVVERRVKALRDRAKAATLENKRVNDAAEARVRLERRKEAQARLEREEMRLVAAVQRRKTLAVACERRREREEVAAAEVAARAKQTISPDGTFDSVRRAWDDTLAWEAVREGVIVSDEARQEELERRQAIKAAICESSFHVRSPAPALSPMYAVAERGAAIAEATRRRTGLTSKQLRLEAAFRERQKRLAEEIDVSSLSV